MKTTHRASLRSLSDALPGSIVAKDFRLLTTLKKIFLVIKLDWHTTSRVLSQSDLKNLGIIHCCMTAIATLAPISTSNARLSYEKVATNVNFTGHFQCTSEIWQSCSYCKLSPDKERLSDPWRPWKVEFITESRREPEEVDVEHTQVVRPYYWSGEKQIIADNLDFYGDTSIYRAGQMIGVETNKS